MLFPIQTTVNIYVRGHNLLMNHLIPMRLLSANLNNNNVFINKTRNVDAWKSDHVCLIGLGQHSKCMDICRAIIDGDQCQMKTKQYQNFKTFNI